MNENIPLSEKHRPKKSSDVKGQELAIDKLKIFINSFNKGISKKNAILFYGPAGTGKTSLAHAIANELGHEIFELNASDLRNRKKLDEVMKPSTLQKSLFNKGKIVLIDEVDGVTATEYGGLAELILLIEKTKHPIIITCNDIWQSKFSLLRQKCEIIPFKEIPYNMTLDILERISFSEGKKIPDIVLKEIAAKSRGDLRAALNDLQSIIHIKDFKDYEEELHLREKSQSIFNAIKEVLKTRANKKTIEAYDNVEMELDQIALWLEENIPVDYKGEELAKAFESLSRADIFKGRIHRQQYWRFMAYENFFLTAGVSAAKGNKNLPERFSRYNTPKRILKIWMMNQRDAKKKTISSKLAELTHTSKKRALRDFYLLSLIIDDKTIKSLNLSDQEQEYLIEKKQESLSSLNINSKI